MKICIPKQYADKFLLALREGKINPDRLIKMSSDERRKFFEHLIGDKEKAKFINTEFESKLLLKNRERGLVTWAQRMAGMRKYKDKDIVEKIKGLEKALTPDEQNHILEDIIEKRLGIGVSNEEAEKILDLTTKIDEAYNPNKEMWQQSDKYYELRSELNRYIRDRIKSSIKTPSLFLNKQERGVALGTLKTATDWLGFGVKELASFLRSMKAGFDFSAPFRQGGALVGTREWRRAFKNMFKYAKSDTYLDDLEIEMMRNKWTDKLMDLRRDLGLTLYGVKPTQMEEQFTGRLFDKIPVARGSERAYVGFLNDLRFRRFTNILDNLEKMGRTDVLENKEALRDIARAVSDATGRGHLGKLEPMASQLATALFSPRWAMSRVRLLLNPAMLNNPIARKEAAKALARQAGLAVSVLGLFKMIERLYPDSGVKVETDSTSSDFGKVKIGNTRVDMTAGLAPYIVFLSRQARGEYKSPMTGVHKLLGTNYGMSRWDLARNFVEYKFSPLFGLLRDTLRGKDFEGRELGVDTPEQKQNTIKYIGNLFVPLTAQDSIDAYKDGSSGVVLSTIASLGSLFGVNINTYKKYPKYQVCDLYAQGDVDDAKQLLDDFVKRGKLTKKQADLIWKNRDIPSDVLYYKGLPNSDKIRFLKKRSLYDLDRYYWESPDIIRKNFDKISEEAKRFIELKNEGKIKRPHWKYQKRL